ncbi:hypothetical protein AB4Z32_26415 [Massilia sp. 2TAF26]|uniref:hypothetical protein n=1 Tax=Massilia sp. 2TAF26 TaxID=3233012 RepID=UPI003F96A8CC
MHIELQRTFGKYTEPQTEDEEADWHQYFSNNPRRLIWEDLHQKRVTVVLGEAGIGKTVELKLEAERMQAAGRHAFFLPLNMLDTVESWDLALPDALQSYEAWRNTSEDGFFFLDAVDEARLHTHADFKRALLVVRAVLGTNFANVRIVISSRVTDWTVLDVQTTVATQILQPIRKAIAQAQLSHSNLADLTGAVAAVAASSGKNSSAAQPSETPGEELFVVTLDPLSMKDAHKCADYFGIEDKHEFWSAVEEGNYEYMASRPLDLQWMVRLWNQRRVLGTYAELIEANIVERLREPNAQYRHARRSLAEAQLREGATELAAAMEFGSVPFLAAHSTRAVEGRILYASNVLKTWAPDEVQLLLATAVFDEASFDRIKFHHRATREYLAAKWVDAKLTLGVPFSRLEPLFARRPNGDLTLIPSRRPVLAWLAAINACARDWVVSKFPEILLHDGDPQSWDRRSADLAFGHVVRATEENLRIRDWFKSRGEYLRISRALSPGQVASVLNDPLATLQARSIAYRLAIHGRLQDCANAALEIYRDKTRVSWETKAALAVLAAVGNPTHRADVLADIEAGIFETNELIAAALSCVTWTAFSPKKLAAIFNRTRSEGEHGTGPMADMLRRDILPATDLPSATVLLQALLLSLPRALPGQRFERYPSGNQPERSWLLHMLPHCLLRVLELTMLVDVKTVPVIVDAAEQITSLRYTGFINEDDVERINTALKNLPRFRWTVALAISQVDDLQHPVTRLVWDGSSVVTFGVEDLVELTSRSHEPSISAAEQDLWFEIGVDVAFRYKGRRARAEALRALQGPHDSVRCSTVLQAYKTRHENRRTQRRWELKDRARKAVELTKRKRAQEKFIANRASVVDGSDFDSLRRVLFMAHQNSAWDDNNGVKLEVVASEAGREVAEIFAAGLKTYWRRVTPPNPSDYPHGQVPWEALAALAGVSLTACEDVRLTDFTAADVAAAAQIAVWALPGPPVWFEHLYKVWSKEVEAALNPWVLAEIRAEQPGTGIRGAFSLAMRCPPHIRRGLIIGSAALVHDEAVKNSDVLKQLVPALFEDGLLSSEALEAVCRTQLERVSPELSSTQDYSWLHLWATGLPYAAWNWFEEHLSTSSSVREKQLRNFANAMGQLRWPGKNWDFAMVSLLLQISEALRISGFNVSTQESDDETFFGAPTKQMYYAIAKGFVGLRGVAGRSALSKMITNETDSRRQSDLWGFLHEHAELDASVDCQWDITRLRQLHSAFDCAPQNEGQLYEQVLARLEEIRVSLEEGPFSERSLFPRKTPEKHLQLWLANKFRETQNKRFSVHREEEVDDDKKTDIQLSCQFGNICVEIKPVDGSRGYSAVSLVDTLRTQMVKQYLKGNNSSRGILVLVQLDSKRWDIPGVGKRQSFGALVKYLQAEAQAIKENSAGVSELTVFPMRCVISS